MSYRSFQITTAPTVTPVTTADIKTHLRITHSDDDTLLDSYATAAQDTLQRLCRRSLMEQTITLKLDTFPSAGIELPRPPALSVTSIQYVDTDGNTQTWSSGDYMVDVSSEPARVVPAYGESYPDVRTETPNSVTVVYQAGHEAVGDVNDTIRLAFKLLVGHYYENREATTYTKFHDLPLGLQMLMAAYEMPEVF